VERLDEGSVPLKVRLQSLGKIRELEDGKRETVSRSDYSALEAKCEELSRQLSTTVPFSDYASLKAQLDESSRRIAEMSAPKNGHAEIEEPLAPTAPGERHAPSGTMWVSSSQR